MNTKYLTFLFFICCSVLVYNCTSGTSENKTSEISGEQLSKVYCVSCHQYPGPELLDKKTWEQYVLPRMGNMMGLYENDSVRINLRKEWKDKSLSSGISLYPEDAAIGDKEWNQIRNFYLDGAPESLTMPERKTIQKGLKHFKILKPDIRMSPPSTTMVMFNDSNDIYTGDAHSESLLHLNSEMKLLNAAQVRQGAVSLRETKEDLWLTVMGSFSPNDEANGFILKLPKTPAGKVLQPIKNLRRPVHSAFGDLTGDGLEDIVVSEFGKWYGRLSFFINMGDGSYDHKVLMDQTGAIRSYLRDFDDDGKLDIIALFGQGNEGIWILYNKGEGQFESKQALPLSPSHGSSFFDLFDFNKDGHEDIIYTAGDNADFPPINKHYHGVYIYENDGNNQFKQSFFHHINGAYAAIPKDYDQDGDYDMAVISFFPDYQNTPEESFVYLENTGNYDFIPFTFEDPAMGRWIVMDAGDYDEDGDQDLILGALAFEVIGNNELVERWAGEGLPFIILENTIR